MRCREYIHITVNVLNVVAVSVLQQLLDEGVTALTHIQAEAIFPQLEFSGTVTLFDLIVCCLMALREGLTGPFKYDDDDVVLYSAVTPCY